MLIEQRNYLRGELVVPGDKSISHRAIMFGALAKGTTEIDGFLMCEDCLSTIDCFRKMNVRIEILPNNKVKITGRGLHGLTQPNSPLNTGKSGTTLRLLLGVLAGQPFSSTLTREESTQKKMVGQVVRPLKKMGANISGREDGNICPLSVTPAGFKLIGMTHHLTKLEMPIKSTLLAAGLYADGRTSIIEALKSRDHSELMLEHFGANINVDNLKVSITPVEELFAQHVEIPGDISIASYFITAGLLVPNSDVTIKNVGINPTRSGILDIYKKMGAKINILNERVVSNEKVADISVKTSSLKGITIEGELVPRLMDEVPIIAIAATMAKGKTIIKNLQGFKVMDSGIIKALSTELLKLGANVHTTEDELIIEGGKPLKGSVVESHNTASIAMSLAIAGLISEGETMIRRSQVLDVAFQDFIPVLNTL